MADRPTLDTERALPQTKELWLEIQDVYRNEEAWFIIQRALKRESERAILAAFAR